MKALRVSMFLGILLAGIAGTAKPCGFSISVSGASLISATGRAVFFHGINRSDAAYSCTGNNGIFTGPVDQTNVNNMKSWNLNVIRLPLNEDCWLGINGAPAAYSGTNYQTAVANYVSLLEANGIYVILDLHWSAPSTYLSTTQEPMADNDHSPAFWTSVATKFANDKGTLFDLYNEPYANTGLTWSQWANGGGTITCAAGGACNGASYTPAGMSQMLSAVRTAEGTGWHHPVMMGGLGSASDLTQWLANVPSDSAHQLMANAHAYNDGQSCQTTTCWDSTFKPIIAAGYPLINNEFGQTACVWNAFNNSVMSWLETNKGSGYLPWVWDGGGACSDPDLVSDWNGTANAYGQPYKTHIATLP